MGSRCTGVWVSMEDDRDTLADFTRRNALRGFVGGGVFCVSLLLVLA